MNLNFKHADDLKINVMPANDLREHVGNCDCWCKPAIDGSLVIHNAMDNREKYENGELKPS